MYSDILQIDGSPLPKLAEEEEAVGVITMEDVIEELLQVLTVHLAHKTIVPQFSTWEGLSIDICFHRRRSLMRRIIILRTHDSG